MNRGNDTTKEKDTSKVLNMVSTGKEKTQEEIVWNNLLDYMDKKNLSAEQQRTYLKNTILYLQYNQKKNKLVNMIIGTPTLLTLLGATGAYFAGNNHLAAPLFVAAGALTIVGSGIKLMKNNPYERALTSVNDINTKENVYRKVAPFIK
jgi:hypothetical protein